jgi:hypothetical protein
LAVVAGQGLVFGYIWLTIRHVAAVRDRRCGMAVVLVVQEMGLAAGWAAELEELLLWVGQR